MRAHHHLPRSAGRGSRAGLVMIVLTATACACAILFRTPIRARYWAQRVVTAETPEQQAAYANLLLNAGDSGRWGIAWLLDRPDAAAREYGVLICGHLHSDWSRQRLLAALEDRSAGVRDLAVLGLARRGDESVVPALRDMLSSGDVERTATAAQVLAGLDTESARAALLAFARDSGDAGRRAVLIDAFEASRAEACVPILLDWLDDHRPVSAPPHAERIAADLLVRLRADGAVATSQPASPRETAMTVAERAAAVLVRITGVDPGFSSRMAADQRTRAKAEWEAWRARGLPGP